MMDGLWMDGKFAVRQLRAHPWFTGISAAILALGIGANTAIFSMINTLLLQPLPFHESDRLIYVWERTAEFDRMSVSSVI